MKVILQAFALGGINLCLALYLKGNIMPTFNMVVGVFCVLIGLMLSYIEIKEYLNNRTK